MIANLQTWFSQNPDDARILFIISVLALMILSYVLTDRLLARGLVRLAGQTATRYDDIVVHHIRPRRIALVAPLLILYFYSYLFGDGQEVLDKVILFLLLWLGVFTAAGLLNAVNDIYELRRGETGVAIRGYLDLIKVFALAVGVILSISIITDQSPWALLAGLSALTAVLLLIFRDTILSFVASIQIAANDLVNEGDWLEVPAYDADGEVIDITLHQVKIQNWDMTISVVPTYKLMETSYRNWRGMDESGGRRIKRSIFINLDSIRFFDETAVEKFKTFPLLAEYMDKRRAEVETQANDPESVYKNSLFAHQVTNISVYRAYLEAYLHHHPRIRQDMSLLVRQLAPTSDGLPIEIYAFTDTTEWGLYEAIQAEIFDHLLAILPEFELRVYQSRSSNDPRF
jgi:miniconductance mechanosensitive channel